MDRAVTVCLVGADNRQEFRDVLIKPGTRCLDVLRELALNGYAIRKPDDSGQFFAANDDVYAAVERASISKLEAVPGMPVAQEVAPSGAASLWERLRDLLVVGPQPTPVVAPVPPISIGRLQPVAVGSLPPTQIQRQLVPLWRERGWQQVDDRSWRGRYTLPQGGWEGSIERVGPRHYRPWIVSPPAVVSSHPHHLCLAYAGQDRYYLHFGTNPTSVDGALMAMENYLAEAYAAARR